MWPATDGLSLPGVGTEHVKALNATDCEFRYNGAEVIFTVRTVTS